MAKQRPQGETVPGEGGRLDIHVANADGTNVMQLTHGPDSYQHPSWSPDGDTIAATRWSSSDGHGDVVLLPIDGPGEMVLTRSLAGDSWDPSWSPDGTRIAFKSSRDSNGDLNDEIWVVNADGSDPTDVTNSSAFEGYPSWSPDGDGDAFVTDVRDIPHGSLTLAVMDVDGGNPPGTRTGVRLRPGAPTSDTASGSSSWMHSGACAR